MDEDFLTTKDLAERLKLSTRTLETWRARKVGPPYLKAGKSVRYDRRAVQEWLSQRKNSQA